MGKLLDEIKAKLPAVRQSSDQFDSTELIGDLKTLTTSQLTKTALSIKNIITGSESGESTETYGKSVPALGTAACKADTCCVW